MSKPKQPAQGTSYPEAKAGLQRKIFTTSAMVLGLAGFIIFAVSVYVATLKTVGAWVLLGGTIVAVSVVVAWLITRIVNQNLATAWAMPQQELQDIRIEVQDTPTIQAKEQDDNNVGQSIAEPQSLPSLPGRMETSTPNTSNNQSDIGEDHFRLLSEHFTHLLSRYTRNGIYLYVSPTCSTLLGYEPDELIGQSAYGLFHPEDLRAIRESQVHLPELPDISTFSHRIRHKDGHYLWVETISKTVRSPDTNAVQEVVAISRDISKRKLIEAETDLRIQQLTILHSAGITVTSSLDLNYVLDTVVQEMTKLMEMETCTISEWDEAEDTVRQIAEFGPNGWWNRMDTAKVYNLKDYPVTKGVLAEQIPEQMTIGQPYLDPSELAYMQAAGVKTLVMMPMVFQQQVVGLLELEDSQKERVFKQHEMSLARLLANQAASAIKNARLYEQAQQELAERKRAEAALKEERALLAQRVEERTIELSKTNAELARVARLKDDFLAGMSHELRTPLNGILGSAEILQAEVFGPLNEQQLKYVRGTEESGRHLLSLINDILDLSKAEAGKLEIEIRPVSVKEVCQASVRLVKELAHKKKLSLSHAVDEQVEVLQADERRLKQILVNLLSNAVKFTPEGGQIGLEVVGDKTLQVVHFTVWDTGIGIPQQQLKDLFQPFVQADTSLAREYEGTGLGLSLVSSMTELHGGGVSVESEVDVGSRFTVSFPWSQAAEEANEANLKNSVVGHSVDQNLMRDSQRRDKPPIILLADDNEQNINTLLDYLLAQGYQMIVARNGREAIKLAQEIPPDLILMDVQMPEMDGLEATRRLRTEAQFAKTPIIALTALAMPGDRDRCLAAGATDYLSKPVSPLNLVETIEHYL